MMRLTIPHGSVTSEYDKLAACLADMSTALANGRTAWLPFYPGGISSQMYTYCAFHYLPSTAFTAIKGPLNPTVVATEHYTSALRAFALLAPCGLGKKPFSDIHGTRLLHFVAATAFASSNLLFFIQTLYD
jgi:hypothetical protein